MKKFLLFLFFAISIPALIQAQCTTTQSTSCRCKDATQTDCDLLPDIEIGHPPFYDLGANFGVIEFSQTGNGADNGRLKVTVSTPNTGFGPLELRATNVFVCGTDTFYGTAPSICPDGISYPRIMLNQRIYHKSSATTTMQFYDRPAGTMTYHPTHSHMHVDNWGNYTLRTKDPLEPNPLLWPIIGTGTKLAFCVEDYGTCADYPDHCLDSAGNSLNTSANFPNYGLGGGGYNCSSTVQGISSGYVDVYWTSLDGMWINIPPGICNGDYWIVCEVDPNQNFEEEYENNNVYAAPFTLTKQTLNPATQPVTINVANSNLDLCMGQTVDLTANTGVSGVTYHWSNGDTTQTATISTSGTYTVDVTNSCGTGTSLPVTINVHTPPAAPVTTDDTIPAPGNAVLAASGNGTINWYDQQTGGTLVGTGSLFSTPFLNSSTTYWAEDQDVYPGPQYHIGPLDNTIGSGGYFNGNQYLIFDAFNSFTLHTVNVYAQTAGAVTITMSNSSGATLQTANVNVSVGLNTLTLDFPVTPGTGYQLTRTSGNSFFRNNPGSALPYPYVLSNLASITGSSAGANYYYFFYDWVLKLPDAVCSGPRSAANAVIDITQNLPDVNSLRSLSVFPNPAKNLATVSFNMNSSADARLEIIDALGQVVYGKNLSSPTGKFTENISLLNYNKGLYQVHLVTSGKTYSKKLIVE